MSGLLKWIKEQNKARIEYTKEHPSITAAGTYGSPLLDKMLEKIVPDDENDKAKKRK